MLKIFNDLNPFFEDVYREISVRGYAKEIGISPPTASKMLKEFEKEKLLLSNKKGIYIYFRANKENYIFKNLVRLYWYDALLKLTEKLHEVIAFKRIVLFGSLSKAENTKNSDIDLFLDGDAKKINVSNIETKLKRVVQLHFKNEVRNKYLRENIERGIIIR